MSGIRDLASIVRPAGSRFRACWRPLALTDLAWKALAVALLSPLTGVLFRALLALGGERVLADQDILLFFAHPVGLAGGVLVGGLVIAIVALEQAALLAVLYAHEAGRSLGVPAALRFALAHFGPVLRTGARIVAWTVMAIAPFLAALGLVYYVLLGGHDINYYLRERPPEFVAALGIGAVIVVALAVVLLRLFSGWLLALPLVLFDDMPPPRALRVSRERARGRRLAFAAWVGGWALAVAAVSMAATSATIWIARAVVPEAAGSIPLLTLAVGVALVVWSLVHLAIHLLGTTTFASMLFVLYRRFGEGGEVDPARLDRFERESRGLHIELTRARLGRWAAIGLVAAFGIGAYLLHSARLEESVQVLAHRGSSKAAPENSMSAFRQAIADGADWIELDVQETADGEVVVFHDSDFMRLAGVATKIWDARRADLAAIDIGSQFAPAFKGERVPTLGEVLDLCKDRVRVLIELKYYGHDQRLEERVAHEVEARGMASQIAVMSLELRLVRKMKALRPGWTVGLLLSVSAGDLGESGADFLAVNAAFASRRFVRRAHSRGMKALAWTVDDAPTMAAMMGRGVDGVITNRPALAKEVAAARAGLSPALRLMLEAAGILGLKPDIRPL